MLDQVRAETNDNEESEDSDDDGAVDDGVVVDLLAKPVMECNLCMTGHKGKTTINRADDHWTSKDAIITKLVHLGLCRWS